MSEVRDSRWTDWLVLIGTVLVLLVVALFFLRNVSPGLYSGAASSVSNAPGP
jgi:hypothetical protein